MSIAEKLELPLTRIILSILLGLGLATFFRTTCKVGTDRSGRCIVITTPHYREIQENIYRQDDDTCVQYVHYPVSCKDGAEI